MLPTQINKFIFTKFTTWNLIYIFRTITKYSPTLNPHAKKQFTTFVTNPKKLEHLQLIIPPRRVGTRILTKGYIVLSEGISIKNTLGNSSDAEKTFRTFQSRNGLLVAPHPWTGTCFLSSAFLSDLWWCFLGIVTFMCLVFMRKVK